MKKLLLTTAALTIAALSLLPTGGADALTTWRTFGNGTATARGEYGSARVSVMATAKNPERLRFVVRTQVPTDGDWSIYCWNESNYRSRSARADFTTRQTVAKTMGTWVANFDYCELDVYAYISDPGTVKVALQARYP